GRRGGAQRHGRGAGAAIAEGAGLVDAGAVHQADHGALGKPGEGGVVLGRGRPRRRSRDGRHDQACHGGPGEDRLHLAVTISVTGTHVSPWALTYWVPSMPLWSFSEMVMAPLSPVGLFLKPSNCVASPARVMLAPMAFTASAKIRTPA